jgi:hypothetical protein
MEFRHCEEQSDEAIQRACFLLGFASLTPAYAGLYIDDERMNSNHGLLE